MSLAFKYVTVVSKRLHMRYCSSGPRNFSTAKVLSHSSEHGTLDRTRSHPQSPFEVMELAFSSGAHLDTIPSMQSALEAVREYYQAFSLLDLNAIALHFAKPCMSIGSQGVFLAQTRADLSTAFAPLLENLRAKGYKRSEFVEPQVADLTETATLVRGVAVRFAATQTELERIPISYLMHRVGAGWKIAVMVL